MPVTARRWALVLAAAVLLGGTAAADDATAPPADGLSARALAEFFLRTKGMSRVLPASKVWEAVRAGTGEYLVVDVRPPDEYARGHVPGAISLPIDVLFRPASLERLRTDAKIVLVCQSGHVESMALGGLVALGFEPWAMRFGMIGWSEETRVKVGASGHEGDAVHGIGAPVEK